jgi:hypothetical protein
MGFFTVILYIIIFYYLFKWLGKIVFPFLFANRIKSADRKRKRAWDEYIYKQKSQEGKVTFNYNKEKSNRIKEGEYVDFEEIQ